MSESDTSALVASFIEDRLAEDERTTIAFRDGHSGPCINYEGQGPEDYSEWDSCSRHIATAKASRYRDTSFGLRDIEAKRRILNEVYAKAAAREYGGGWDDAAMAMWDVLRLLALPYADHADYRPEWSPGDVDHG